MVKIEDERFSKALDDAVKMGGSAMAMKTGNGRYSVASRTTKDIYRIMIVRDSIVCSCKAGQFENPCWHGAAAWLLHEELKAPVEVAHPVIAPPSRNYPPKWDFWDYPEDPAWQAWNAAIKGRKAFDLEKMR